MRQRYSSSSCTQATPAGLPAGIPGIGEVIDGAMQHAPQPGRQSMAMLSGVPIQPGDQARGIPAPAAHGLHIGVELIDQGSDR